MTPIQGSGKSQSIVERVRHSFDDGIQVPHVIALVLTLAAVYALAQGCFYRTHVNRALDVQRLSYLRELSVRLYDLWVVNAMPDSLYRMCKAVEDETMEYQYGPEELLGVMGDYEKQYLSDLPEEVFEGNDYTVSFECRPVDLEVVHSEIGPIWEDGRFVRQPRLR